MVVNLGYRGWGGISSYFTLPASGSSCTVIVPGPTINDDDDENITVFISKSSHFINH